MDCREMDLKTNNKKEMKAITTWFFTGGGSGGEVRVEGEYRSLTSLSLQSSTEPSSYKRTIMSVSYHMKLFNKFITTFRLSCERSTCEKSKTDKKQTRTSFS